MRLTVAIATWNRADLLAQTLASLATVHVPMGTNWEVLVCDNNSTDNTKVIVEQAAADTTLQNQPGLAAVRYLFEGRQGKSHALNQILREATGEWIFFLDDDVIVDAAWMRSMVDAIATHPKAAILGGPILPRLYRKVSATEQFLLNHYPGAYGVLDFDKDHAISYPQATPGGANMAVRRDVALAIGFDPALGMFAGQRLAGEDASMAWRIVGDGHEGWMIAAAKVLHHTPDSCLGKRRLFDWQRGIGRTWVVERGKPTPGKFGVAWWAWREVIRRYLRTCLRWRPWPTQAYYKALVETAQYWGYLKGK